MKYIFTVLFLLAVRVTAAQDILKVIVKDNHNHFLIGAVVNIVEKDVTRLTNEKGEVMFENITAGTYTLSITYLGFQEETKTIHFPEQKLLHIVLKEEIGEMDEVVVSSTRSSRYISDIPTRIETITGEELAEKANMRPGDIRILLSESTGIQTQVTSATSGNSSIRIQGLDGRYTQILKDGMPLYSGAASGLGLLQIPPLDLKRVEVIKGSTSTLYGGGAIAGLVNLISKTPEVDKEFNVLLNLTNAGGLDASTFYAKRNERVGTTVFASYNQNKAYDPSDLGLTAIPKFQRFSINPKLFLYPSDKTSLNFGLNLAVEDRLGGNKNYIENPTLTGLYFEENKTDRVSTQFDFKHIITEGKELIVKNSLSYFKRSLNVPGYGFKGSQYASFTEVAYHQEADNTEWILGANLWTDAFNENNPLALDRTYHTNTLGAFVQNTWFANQKLNIESGLRTDYVFDYGLAVLPRLSVLFKVSPKFSSRIGGGFGYKSPTIFTEESERYLFQGVLPIDRNANKLEKSYGANWDFNYKTALLDNSVSFSVNHLFFYTRIDNPLMLENVGTDRYRLTNISGNIDSKGTETNIKLGYDDFKLFLGYTFTDAAIRQQDISRQNYLTPKHRINSVLFYEVHDKWKIGFEAYYFSKQKLSDNATGKPYWITGIMAEKIWDKFSVYINFENFTDSRQTRFDTIYTGSINQPVFRDIYAPLEGFVINGGIKIRL